jgi:hypothetical protein
MSGLQDDTVLQTDLGLVIQGCDSDQRSRVLFEQMQEESEVLYDGA